MAVAVELVSVVVTDVGTGGVLVTSSTINCGLESVTVSVEYIPVGTLAKFKMVEKSISLAKSTVTGWPEGSTETGVPPFCGVRVAAVIVTVNEITSQTGASLPNTTTEPMVAGAELTV